SVMWAGWVRSGMPMRLRERSNDSSVRMPYPPGSAVMGVSRGWAAGSATRLRSAGFAEVVLAHESAADLKRGCPRQVADHLDRDRPLVGGQPAREVVHQLLRGRAAGERDRYGGHFSQPRVGQSDSRCLVDGRVREEGVLDHGGRD